MNAAARFSVLLNVYGWKLGLCNVSVIMESIRRNTCQEQTLQAKRILFIFNTISFISSYIQIKSCTLNRMYE